MNTSSPTKPGNTGSLSGAKEQKRSQNLAFRIVTYIIISALCNGLLVAAAGASQEKLPLVVLFLYSLVPTVVLGLAFAIVQHYDDRARSLEENAIRSKDVMESLQKRYTEEIEGLSKRSGEDSHKISGLIDGFNTLVKDTGTTLKFYSTVRTILEDGYAQKDLIRAFLNRAMNGPLFIQPMDREEFYNLAEQGIRQCTISWHAI